MRGCGLIVKNNIDEEKWWQLRELLIKEGKFQDVSTINANTMTYKIKEWPAEFVDKISGFLIKKLQK